MFILLPEVLMFIRKVAISLPRLMVRKASGAAYGSNKVVSSKLPQVKAAVRGFSGAAYGIKKAVLPTVSYKLPLVKFNEQVFNGLKEKRGIILEDLSPAYSPSITNIFTAYQEFLRQPESAKQPYDESYHPHTKLVYGSRACNRYFLSRDSRGILTHKVPAPIHVKVSLQDAADVLHTMVDGVVGKLVAAIDHGFNTKKMPFSRALDGYTSTTVVDSYLPITQERLKYMAEQGKLTKDKNGDFESFLPHKDLDAFTILFYPENNCLGFEVNTAVQTEEKKFQSVSLNSNNVSNLQALVVSGELLSVLTDGQLASNEHRVNIPTMALNQPYWRNTLSIFVSPDFSRFKMFHPLVIRPSGETHIAPISPEDFIAVNEARYMQDEKARACFPSEKELSSYPMQEDITSIEKPDRTVYYREK